MSFIRPEAEAAIRRWFEPALAGAVTLYALREGWVYLARGDSLGVVALAGAVVAGLWCRGAVVRALAARTGDAPGIVEVKERQIRHFSPLTGGVMALDSLVAIEVFVPARGMTPLWRLTDETGERMVIPSTAKGADALTAAFAALPGFSDVAALSALRREEAGHHPVWQRPVAAGVARLGRS